MMTTPSKSPSRLSDKWVFWQDKWVVRDGETVQSLIDLGEADTARGFWQIFDSNSVEALPENCSLQVFKGQVKPEWEDPANINGGHFRFTPLPDQNASPSKLWYNLIASAIGGQFTLASSICGLGFTNKGARKVVSVWISTTEPSIVRSLQAELHTHTADKFVVKFVCHRELPRSAFMAQQSVWHRRTKSAPMPFVSIDFDEEEGPTQAPPAAANGEGGMRRRNAPGPLDSKYLPGITEHDAEAHLRSKSKGVGREVVPQVHTLATASNLASATSMSLQSQPSLRPSRQSPAPAPAISLVVSGVPGSGGDWATEASVTMGDMRESGSGVYPTVKAPTPLKEWADQWSPSLLHAAMQNRAPLPTLIATHSAATSPGAGEAEAVTVQQHGLLSAANATTADSPLNLSSTQPQSSMLTVFGAAQDRVAQHQLQHLQHPQQQPTQRQADPFSAAAMGSNPFAQPFTIVGQPHHQQHGLHPYDHAQAPSMPPLLQPYPPGAYGAPQPHNPYHVYAGQSPPHPYGAAHGSPAAHLPASALPGAQPLPYVIVRQPVAHHSEAQANAARGHPAAANAPRRQGVAQPGTTTPPMVGARKLPEPQPRGPLLSRAPMAGVAASAVSSNGRRESPAPAPHVETEKDRRVQHTKSDSPAFVWKGWQYPAGLNRKERRRIMFADEVIPAEYPGAVFVGEDVPDGAVGGGAME